MNEQKNQNPLIEVTVERNFDVMDKSWDDVLFTRLHHTIRTSGLLAKLSDKNFRTLVCLATFMDAEGHCFPSQEALAKALGISRTAVSKRIKSLLAFRWQGKPLIYTKKVRGGKGIFENTVYTVLPESSLRIFDTKRKSNHVNTGHVARGHTNYSQTNNNILNTVTEYYKFKKDDPLAMELATAMDDTKSLPYYKKMVSKYPAYILLRTKGEVLEEPQIKRSKGAMFAYLVKKYTDPQKTSKIAS